MRFKFCGDLDCPDWVLAEITTLSKLTSVKMKLLCVQIINNILGKDIDYEKVHKLTSDAKFEVGDIKGSIAAQSFIISSAAKYGVTGEVLSNELQQLGLPKEHSISLCKSYADNLDKLQAEFRSQSLRLSQLESVDWRVDYILSSSKLQEVKEPSAQIQLHVKKPESERAESSVFTVSPEKLGVLLHELKQAQSAMSSLGS